MLGFAVSLPAPDVPRQVTKEEIDGLFSPDGGWAVTVSWPGLFRTRGFDDVPALALCAERTTGPEWRPAAEAHEAP